MGLSVGPKHTDKISSFNQTQGKTLTTEQLSGVSESVSMMPLASTDSH